MLVLMNDQKTGSMISATGDKFVCWMYIHLKTAKYGRKLQMREKDMIVPVTGSVRFYSSRHQSFQLQVFCIPQYIF